MLILVNPVGNFARTMDLQTVEATTKITTNELFPMIRRVLMRANIVWFNHSLFRTQYRRRTLRFNGSPTQLRYKKPLTGESLQALAGAFSSISFFKMISSSNQIGGAPDQSVAGYPNSPTRNRHSHVLVGPMQSWVAFDTSGQEWNEQVLTVLVDDRRVSS